MSIDDLRNLERLLERLELHLKTDFDSLDVDDQIAIDDACQDIIRIKKLAHELSHTI